MVIQRCSRTLETVDIYGRVDLVAFPRSLMGSFSIGCTDVVAYRTNIGSGRLVDLSLSVFDER